MNTKANWRAIHDAMTRERGSEPPTAEEMLAYKRGELGPEDEARVRELLVEHPELARAMAIDFPTDDVGADDPAFVSPEKIDSQWAALQSQIHRRRAPRPIRWKVATAFAAMLAVTFGALLWQARRELAEPRLAFGVEGQLLMPDGSRGPAQVAVIEATEGTSFVVTIPVVPRTRFRDYRLEIVQGARSLWRSGIAQPSDDETFSIDVPRAFAEPGRYQIVLYGADGAREERVATYSFRVPRR